jgi:hypothetical protein
MPKACRSPESPTSHARYIHPVSPLLLHLTLLLTNQLAKIPHQATKPFCSLGLQLKYLETGVAHLQQRQV